MKKITLALLVASALSAEVWVCSNIGMKDDSYELGYGSNDINSTIIIKNNLLTLKAGNADAIQYIKQGTTLDGFSYYRNKKTKDIINTNRYNDDRRLFLVDNIGTSYMISGCEAVKWNTKNLKKRIEI